MQENGESQIGATLQCIISGYSQSYGLSFAAPRPKKVHFDFRHYEITTRRASLYRLVDVETLFITDLSTTGLEKYYDYGRDDGLLSALSNVNADGPVLLPRLRTIVSMALQRVMGSLRTEPILREMLRPRSGHRAPMKCMRMGPSTDFREDWVVDEDKKANEDHRELVAAYTPHE